MVNIIVAVSDNLAIGRSGDMPWHIGDDLRYFKRVTSGHTVIMGRRTWESIGSRPLKNRRNIVVSRTMEPAEGFEVATTLKKAIRAAGRGEKFIMGGGQLYAAAMPLARRLYITRVHTVVEDADTFFPAIDPEQWALKERSETFTDAASGLTFEFEVYERK
ncbi:MAG: dihydrofolate reductase [Bacteroidales bacterium]|nr:dihydrofolate reductase [Bacteroidales bacterium]